MSRAKQVTAEHRGPPRAASPRGSRQVVIRINSRAVYVLLGVVAVLLALVAGVVVGRVIATPSAPAQPAPLAAVQGANPEGLVVKTAVAPSVPGLDPNLDGFQVATASDTFSGGPRVGVSDVDKLSSFNLGDIPADKNAEHTFKLKNVGNQDLVIGQIYASCGCTIPSVAGRTMDKEGKLDSPLTLKPGEEHDLTITYSPQVLGDEGEIKKFIQIFSNDPTGKSGENRFRLTGNVVK